MAESVVDALLREFNAVSGQRSVWEAHWEEIAERVYPSYSGLFQSHGLGRTPGEKRTDKIYDSTPQIALGRFAAAMESMLTPRNGRWHRIAPPHFLKRDRDVRLWCEEATDVLFRYRYAPKANFASQNHQNYIGLGAFGTGCLFTDELTDEPGLRYRAIHLGEIYFVENHQGIIDKALRRFPMSARQIAQKWGEGVLTTKMKGALAKNSEEDFYILHCVKPREDVDRNRKDYRGMAFVSYYVAMEDRKLLNEGGYHTFPYSISRYVQAPGELYGRSPAMEALPSVKTLMEQQKTILKQGHRALDPVLLTHDDGVIDGFSSKPGALNSGAVTADGRPLVHALPSGSIAVGKDMIEQQRMLINDAFLVTLFQILVDTPQMTATEVLERAREKGALLSPTMGRQQSEYLGPLIERELDVLSRQRLLPPMPPALIEAGGQYSTEYDSPLSRAQRAEEASGLMRSVEFALKVALETQNPEPLDHYDWDVIVPELNDIQAVPERWRRSMAQIRVIRQQRLDAQKTQQNIEAAPAAAAMMKARQEAQAA